MPKTAASWPSKQDSRSSTPVVAATPKATRDALLRSHHRAGAPIRRTFLQEYGGDRLAGPLHHFVQERQLFALQLYLLLHCLALRSPWDRRLPAGAWARALDKTGPGGEASVSRAWRWLKAKKLVRTVVEDRELRVYLLDESGTDDESKLRTKPKGGFFTFPRGFFLGEFHSKLKLPGTATLLVALHEASRTTSDDGWFQLRTEIAAKWYAISSDTLQRGLDELREHKVLTSESRKVEAPLSRYGWLAVNHYKFTDALDAPTSSTDNDLKLP